MLIRNQYLEKILSFSDLDIIKVITGIRRCGKSTIMKQLQSHFIENGIKEDHILYYNFESFLCKSLLHEDRLYKEIKQKISSTAKRYYIFLDEIQNVENWQVCINALQVDFDCDLYITGSNAKLLSGELATYIAGRFIEIKVYPFSFHEYIEAQDEQKRKLSKEDYFKEYVLYGGMPFSSYLSDKSNCREYMSGVYATIVLNDMIARNRLRNPDMMERILSYAIDNIGHTFSANSITKYLKHEHISISVDTVISYMRMASDAMLLHKVMRRDVKGKELMKTQEKYYVSDHGFKQYLFGNNEQDIELVLENIVYIEMLRRGYQVYIGAINQKEIDFICEKEGNFRYLQVCYLMPNQSTRDREFAPLLLIPDNYEKIVLSLDTVDFSQNGIQHRNIIQFLLD